MQKINLIIYVIITFTFHCKIVMSFEATGLPVSLFGCKIRHLVLKEGS
jgi:hypothetical protein